MNVEHKILLRMVAFVAIKVTIANLTRTFANRAYQLAVMRENAQ